MTIAATATVCRRCTVSTLHAHLVFVTKFRGAVFTDAVLTCCEHTMRSVCAGLDVEPVEYNGETDHVHLLVAHRRPWRSRS
jgi:putative transposase